MPIIIKEKDAVNKKHILHYFKIASLLSLCIFTFSFLLSGCAQMEPDTIHHLKIQVRNLNRKVANLSQNSTDSEQALHQTQVNVANQGAKIASVKSNLSSLYGKYEIISHDMKLLQTEFRNYRILVNKELIKLLKKEKFKSSAISKQKITSKVTPKIVISKVKPVIVPKISIKQLALRKELKEYGRAKSYYNKGLYKKALVLFKKYLNKYPQSPKAGDANYYKSVSNFKLKNYPVSILEFHKFTRLYPKNKHVAMAIYLQGVGFSKLSDPSDAIILFKQVIADYSSSKAAALAKSALEKLAKQ
ncbi:MAG: outer membrane protein assembly factor BamD [Candidatus Acididesulfobacter guangdongensis]|uniref:Outer membrane protein assembly factor BamD n=1 Tax=Acididesulfobacter guangdongensis TaxID=2597225 RepID=A0A519BH07_ACIG2|nr:MAG: outer membrane protein assembly factor BamD [Candidatus Acididesulfobacter guangdongensis]